MMEFGRYIGPDDRFKIKSGKMGSPKPRGSALILRSEKPGVVLAQFDGWEAWRFKNDPGPRHPETGKPLCFGWHEFPEEHWEIESEGLTHGNP